MLRVDDIEMVDAILDRLTNEGRAMARADVERVLDLELEFPRK